MRAFLLCLLAVAAVSAAPFITGGVNNEVSCPGVTVCDFFVHNPNELGAGRVSAFNASISLTGTNVAVVRVPASRTDGPASNDVCNSWVSGAVPYIGTPSSCTVNNVICSLTSGSFANTVTVADRLVWFLGANSPVEVGSSGLVLRYAFTGLGRVETQWNLLFVSGADQVSTTACCGNGCGNPCRLSGTINGASCFGVADGSVTYAWTDATGPYSYVWSDGFTQSGTPTGRTGLAAGTYSVTGTDSNGCVSVQSNFVIPGPTEISVSLTPSTAVCTAPGAIVTTVSGGTPTYTFAWSNGATTQGLASAPAGAYSLTVTDIRGCQRTASTTVPTRTDTISVVGFVTNVTCFGGTNGAITVETVEGGTAPYTFAWADGATTRNRVNLVAGTYSGTVTDANGCTRSGSYVVGEPSALTGTLTSTPTACNANSGTVTLTASGGVAPYSFAWSNGATTQNLANLAPGPYSVTVTDANGCQRSGSTTVAGGTANIILTSSVGNVGCNGGNNGFVTLLSVSGGTEPYSFAWSNGATTRNIVGLVAGDYTVTVTDANGCTTTGTFSVTQPSALAGSVTLAQNVSCNGGSNGIVNFPVSGGTSPYSFAWADGVTTQNRVNVPAGTYSATVTDARGCTRSGSVTVTQPSALTGSLSTTPASCGGASDGSVTLTVGGGVSPYSFAWSNSRTTQNLANVAAGTYTVTVTDSNGCQIVRSTVVSSNALFTLSFSSTPVSCNGGNNGSLTVTASPASANYAYLWSNGATTRTISALTAGSYSVTVTDGTNPCTAAGMASVTQPAPLVRTSLLVFDVSCNGGTNGGIQQTVAGGTQPYAYAWSTGATTRDLSNVAAGTYGLTVTDANGCVLASSFQVSQPTALVASATPSTATCGIANGAVSLSVSGGSLPYSYLWSNGATTQNIVGVGGGLYSVTVTDARGCQRVTSATVSTTTALSVSLVSSNAGCPPANGTVTSTVSGAAGPYTYLWSNGATTANIAGLASGSYSVTVTAANGCQGFSSAAVNCAPRQCADNYTNCFPGTERPCCDPLFRCARHFRTPCSNNTGLTWLCIPSTLL